MKKQLLLFAFLPFLMAKAQNPGDMAASKAVSETQDVQVEVLEFPEDKLTESVMNSLARQGKSLDAINSDGSIYVIASGTTTRPSNMPGFILSRNVAYSIAEMTAKMNLLRMAGEQITSGRGFEMIDDKIIGEDPDQKKKAGMLKKAKMVMDKSLDKALSALGVSDEEIQKLNESNKKAVFEQKYNESIRSFVSGMVKGCAVVRICEGEAGNNDYQVSVCMKYSPEFQSLSAMIKNRDDSQAKQGKSTNSMDKILGMTPDKLVGRMGTYITYDQNGDMVVYGFGQEEVNASGTRASAEFSRAYSKARLSAVNNIKNFVAEDMIADEVSETTEKFQQYADGTDSYFSQQKWSQAVQSKSTTLNLPTTMVRKWKGIHPVSKQNVAGVVVMWSPTIAARADELKETFTEPEPANGNNQQAQPQKTKKSNYTVTGEEEEL
ncbi:DUF6844 domain-containing protein [Saccharicrinis sp. FJH2]|uniref:DUF6844 domain-containing protein n=1 Tax=Saccharicrinis sp. FJH65 TaxID=3344659 RepID=UPI0035F2E983